MNCCDDIFTPDNVMLKELEAEHAEIHPPFECDYSMNIELRAVKPENEKDLTQKLDLLCDKMANKFFMNTDSQIVYFKLGFKKEPLLWHRLIKCLCQHIKINGNSDSFAIIKFYRGNCMSGEATFIYEDYVTPGYSMDTFKLERFIKENP